MEKEEEERTGEVGERGLELEQKSTKVGLSKVHLLLLLLLSSLLFVAVVIVAAVGWVLQGRGGGGKLSHLFRFCRGCYLQ